MVAGGTARASTGNECVSHAVWDATATRRTKTDIMRQDGSNAEHLGMVRLPNEWSDVARLDHVVG
jgi:hypothetical protein